MIKKTLVGLASMVLIAGSIGFATATPVTFNIDWTNSAVNLTDVNTGLTLPWGTVGADTSISASLSSIPDFTLADGAKQRVDFIDFTVDGNGIGEFNISATLAFADPIRMSFTSTGNGGWGTVNLGFWGRLSGGLLEWADPSQTVTIADGNSLTVAFENGVVLGAGATKTVDAYITNNGGATETPEPSTIITVGILMLGLLGYNRKRFGKKFNNF